MQGGCGAGRYYRMISDRWRRETSMHLTLKRARVAFVAALTASVAGLVCAPASAASPSHPQHRPRIPSAPGVLVVSPFAAPGACGGYYAPMNYGYGYGYPAYGYGYVGPSCAARLRNGALIYDDGWRW